MKSLKALIGFSTYIPQSECVSFLRLSYSVTGQCDFGPVLALGIPRCLSKSRGPDFLDLFLKTAVISNPPLTLLGLLLAESFGGALAIQKPRPPVIHSVQFWGLGLTGTVGFATGARSGGDASGQQGKLDVQNNFFVF